MSTIKSREELEQLLADRPAATRTFSTTAEVIASLQNERAQTARPTPESDIQKLAEFLDVPREDLGGPFEVDERFVCPNCNRSLSFLDIMTTAVESGAHIRHLASDPDTLPGAYAFRTTGAAGKNPAPHLITWGHDCGLHSASPTLSRGCAPTGGCRGGPRPGPVVGG